MSGLPWVRFDTAFPRNHKVLVLLGMRDGHRSAFAYTCGLAYCGEHGTDGFIPREALPFLHCRKSDAERLVTVGLWIAEDGGWTVNDWREYQPSSEEHERRAAKARIAAAARWSRVPRQETPQDA